MGVVGKREENTVSFVGVTQPDEGVKGKRRIPNPRCSVVPVPPAAYKLWERECGTSHDSASRFIDE